VPVHIHITQKASQISSINTAQYFNINSKLLVHSA